MSSRRFSSRGRKRGATDFYSKGGDNYFSLEREGKGRNCQNVRKSAGKPAWAGRGETVVKAQGVEKDRPFRRWGREARIGGGKTGAHKPARN